jgi:hypothetical protein
LECTARWGEDSESFRIRSQQAVDRGYLCKEGKGRGRLTLDMLASGQVSLNRLVEAVEAKSSLLTNGAAANDVHDASSIG